MPYYESLSLEKIQGFCQQHHNEIDRYLPDSREIHKVSREWICNIIATVLKNIFTDWVKKQIEDRNEKVTVKKNLEIEMDPDIAAAFNASSSVSRKY